LLPGLSDEEQRRSRRRECLRKSDKKHRGRRIAYQRAYRAGTDEAWAAYYAEFPPQIPQSHEQRLETRSEWRRKAHDRELACGARYREKNREALREREAKRRREQPEKIKAAQLKHREKHRAGMQAKYRALRAKVLRHYGGTCVCCGESNLCFLTIDHVHNDGNLHRKAHVGEGDYEGSGYSIYRYLEKRQYPTDRFQVLCYNCNGAKQHDPVGHRAAHPNAINIDGLGELISGATHGRRSRSHRRDPPDATA
jgi:hypothetical protein